MSFAWTTHRVAAGTCTGFRIGRLSLWVRHEAEEWRLAHQLTDEPGPAGVTPDCRPPDGLEWVRVVDPEHVDEIRLLPVMPARPLVVRPDSTLHLPPAARCRLYIGIPVHVRVELPLQRGTAVLAEWPTQKLSKTWFGAPDDSRGLLCLALHSRARLVIDDLGPAKPARAVCTMRLNNVSGEHLEYRSLALLTDHLGLSRSEDGRLWTTTVAVDFKGTGVHSGVRYLNAYPAGIRQLTVLTPPRMPIAEGLADRLFGAWTR